MKTIDDHTQTIALQAFTFIAEREDILTRFLGQSGVCLEDLRTSLLKPETLAAVLDFLLQEDKMLLDFCETQETTPENIWRARNQLPGGLNVSLSSI